MNRDESRRGDPKKSVRISGMVSRMLSFFRQFGRDERIDRASIANKLLKAIWGVYLFFTLLTMTLLLQLEYRQEKSKLDEEIERMVETARPNIASAVWNLNDRKVKAELFNILHNEYVAGFSFHTAGQSKEVDAELQYPAMLRLRNGQIKTLNTPRELASGIEALPWWNKLYDSEHEIYLHVLLHQGKIQDLGTLKLYTSSYVIIEQAFYTMAITALNELFRMVILCFVTYLLVARWVSKPMRDLADALDLLDPASTHDAQTQNSLRERFASFSDHFESRRDEIGAVFRSFQRLKISLEKNEKTLQENRIDLERKVEERTQHLEKVSQAKSEFIAKMSHEIRTPMNGVLGMAELLSDTALSKQQMQYLNTIQNSGKALLDIINDILDYSKIEAGKMEIDTTPYNLETLIDECLSIFSYSSAQCKLPLAAMYEEDVPLHLVGDPVRIRQILINFLGNAFKFTNEGQILIKVSLEKTLGAQDRLIKIEVIDSGIGIDLDKQKLVFDSFTQADGSTTRKFGGTGLGLDICKRLANLMGGEIGLKSQVGVGSNFWFTVVQEELEEVDLIKPTVIPKVFSKKHLLLIDRNSHIRAMLASSLRGWGFQVRPVASLAAAGAALLDGETSYDMVLFFNGGEETEQIEELGALAEALVEVKMPLIYALDPGGGSHRVHSRLRQIFSSVVTLDRPIRFRALRESLLEVLNTLPGGRATEDVVMQIKREKGVAFVTEQAFGHLRVLVAEDNNVNQVVIVGMLKKIGIVPDMANNGVEALQQFTEQLDRGDGYDLVLMDCEMPELDGWEATKKIRAVELEQQAQPVIIVALSAHALNIERERAESIGMDGFLSKPVSLNDLLRKLSALNTR